MCNGNCGGNSCSWILILILVLVCCGGFGGCGNGNGCGCDNGCGCC